MSDIIMEFDKELVFITGNLDKLTEVRNILGFEVLSHKLDLPEVQGIEVIDVVREKVKAAYDVLKKPVMVEDTGVYFDGMNKFPGALIKWVEDSVGNDGIVKMISGFSDLGCCAETIVGVYDGKEFSFYSGKVYGKIVSPRGENGFGWDKVLEVSGFNKTFGEMSSEEKNKCSMRKLAFENMKSGNKVE